MLLIYGFLDTIELIISVYIDELPHLRIPLHHVIKLTPVAYGKLLDLSG